MVPTDDTRDGCAARLERAARRWVVAIEGVPMHSPNGCVAYARRQTGEPVVVKVTAPRSDERRGWAALRHWDGRASVRLLDHADGVALIERALPGRPLSELVLAGRDDEATAQLCAVAAALHRLPPPAAAPGVPSFPSVADWGRGLERYRRSGAAVLPRALVDRAAHVFAELAASQAEPRLLHGDLHHFNILLDDARGWLAVDSKGLLGEPAYEFGAALRNPAGAGYDPALYATPTVVERRSHIIAEQLGLDRRRLLAWAFAQAVLSAVWSWEDGEPPRDALIVARAILPML